jgi:predicted O-methyltransferase YrrM
MKKWLRSQLLRLPPAKGLKAELDALKKPYPPGHYAHPVPNIEEIRANRSVIFNRTARELPGIHLREKEQLDLLQELLPFYEDQPFPEEKTSGFRYWLNNSTYAYSDGLFLYSLMRFLKPKKIIEVGSGLSSALMLDTDDFNFKSSIQFTFIEPYPAVLKEMTRELPAKFGLHELPVQKVSLHHFCELEANDILFIDSSHVAKIGSDVNFLIFQVLPLLKKNVYIHFHDVFYPFEYPEQWVYQGISWNEDYILRAFLMHNQDFEIVLFNTYLEMFHAEWFQQHMPLCLKNTGGSLWIRKC